MFCMLCDCVTENTLTSMNYKVIIGLQDDSGTTTFTLLNDDAEQLIDTPI